MLLGDEDEDKQGRERDKGKGEARCEDGEWSGGSRGRFDVLHATSAALMAGMRDIVLDSDFENAMKTVTSWVPIKDDDLLMKVVLAKYSQHSRRKKGT